MVVALVGQKPQVWVILSVSGPGFRKEAESASLRAPRLENWSAFSKSEL